MPQDSEINLSYLASLGYNRSGLYIINITSAYVSYVDILSCQIFKDYTDGSGILKKKISSTHDFNEDVALYALWNGNLLMFNKQQYQINVSVVYVG